MGLAALGVVVAFGLKFYNKSATAKEVKQEMLNICQTDSGCQNSVNTHFQKCFERSYSLGSRRRSGSLNARKLTDCINNNSGVAYFDI